MRFTEEQRFSRWWSYSIIFLIVLPLIRLYKAFEEHDSREGLPDNFYDSLVIIGLIILFSSFFVVTRLKTDIDKNEIRMQFYPVLKKTILWKDVKRVQVVDYGFVGGWGIRFLTPYGTVYNVKGSDGLALELKNGKKLLIGTQRAEELKRLLRKANG